MARPFDTNRSFASGDSTAPIGRGGIGSASGLGSRIVSRRVRRAAFTTEIDAEFSSVTNSVSPSGVIAIERGRRPTMTRPSFASDVVSTATTV